MTRQVLYAYIEGTDLEGIAPAVEVRCNTFISNRTWIGEPAWLVNQKHDANGSLAATDELLWDLGINIRLPDPGSEAPAWFGDVKAVVGFLGQLHSELGRDIVIGIWTAEAGIGEDIFWVSCDNPDPEELARLIGTGDGR